MTPPAISEIGIGRCGEALAGRPPRAATAHLPLVVLTLVAALFAGCASRSPTPAPVEDRAPARTPPPVGPIGTIPRAPERPEFYTVRAGDSIYSIAVSQGVDYRDLMAMNNIVDASRLSPGQVLRLRPAQAAATPAPPPPPAEPPVQVNPIPSTAPIEVRPLPAPTSIPPAPIGQKPEPPRTEAPRPDGSAPAIPAGVRGEPRAYKLPYSDENVAMIQRGGAVGGQAAVPAPPARVEPPRIDPKADAPKPQVEAKVDPRPPAANGEDRDRIDWAWPTPGRVAERFEGNNKGVGITGKVGEPVAAAAGGRVVYSGSGLRGYGQLIIIKHNDTYLSAYAHNSKILVKEGQTVTKGQKIAEIGSTDADRPKLHFEIRKNGKPVDPLGYLPERP